MKSLLDIRKSTNIFYSKRLRLRPNILFKNIKGDSFVEVKQNSVDFTDEMKKTIKKPPALKDYTKTNKNLSKNLSFPF